MLTALWPKATLLPVLLHSQGYLIGASCYALNVGGFMGQGYLVATATLLPILQYLIADATLWVRFVMPRMLTDLWANATLLPRLPYGWRRYALKVDKFMSQRYLIANATSQPRLPYRCALLRLNVDGFMCQGYLVANATF